MLGWNGVPTPGWNGVPAPVRADSCSPSPGAKLPAQQLIPPCKMTSSAQMRSSTVPMGPPPSPRCSMRPTSRLAPADACPRHPGCSIPEQSRVLRARRGTSCGCRYSMQKLFYYQRHEGRCRSKSGGMGNPPQMLSCLFILIRVSGCVCTVAFCHEGSCSPQPVSPLVTGSCRETMALGSKTRPQEIRLPWGQLESRTGVAGRTHGSSHLGLFLYATALCPPTALFPLQVLF